jgi:hypothetical protein
VTAHPEVLVQLRDEIVADGEGFNEPEANTKHPFMVRVWRSAGVLRPWHAGRDTSKNLGDPMGSWVWEALTEGMQLLRHEGETRRQELG